jgi:membrane-associated phospholipid phosphatase
LISAVRRREEWLLLLLAVACLGLAWFFAKVGSEVLEGELLAVDRIAQQWVARHRSPIALAFFHVVTFLGAKELLAPLGALLGWRLFRGTKALIAFLAFSALASAEFVALIKRNFHIARPAGGIAAGLGYSFPSGHATGSTAMAIVLAYVSIRQRTHARVLVPICATVAVLVGVSRVYLGVHWASDVIGGWLVGAAFGIGCWALYELIERKSQVMKGDPSPEPVSRPAGSVGK